MPSVVAVPASPHIFAIAQLRCSDSLHVSHTVATSPATLEPRRARYESRIIPQITANSAGLRARLLNSRLHSERLNKSTAQLQVTCVRHRAVPVCRAAAPMTLNMFTGAGAVIAFHLYYNMIHDKLQQASRGTVCHVHLQRPTRHAMPTSRSSLQRPARFQPLPIAAPHTCMNAFSNSASHSLPNPAHANGSSCGAA